MRRKHLYLPVLATLIAIVWTSCGGSSVEESIIPPAIPDKPVIEDVTEDSDSITITFKLGGEIGISEEPLNSRAGTNDLYGLNVFQTLQPIYSSEDYGNHYYNLYAYGVFDNLGYMTLKLAKNRYYHFELVYVPDAKKLVYQYNDGHFGSPFQCMFADNPVNGKINELLYSTKNNLDMMDSGATQEKGNDDYKMQANQFTDIERYQGTRWNFLATDESKSVDINLYRMMTGIKLIVDDFTEGSISVYSTHGKRYTIYPAKNSTTNVLDIVVELPTMPSIEFLTLMDHERFGELVQSEQPFVDEQVNGMYITYNKNGQEIALYSNVSFVYKRLTKHVLQFSVSDAFVNGGITPDIKDDQNGELEEGEWSW